MTVQTARRSSSIDLSPQAAASSRRIKHFNQIICSEIGAAHIKAAMYVAGLIVTTLVSIACLFQ